MKNHLLEACVEGDLPVEAVTALLAAYTLIDGHSQARTTFEGYVDRYNADTLEDYGEALEQMAMVAEWIGISVYTVNLLFFLCLGRHTRRLYHRLGYGEVFFEGIMIDLRCKLLECRKRYGIWGTSSEKWHPPFFQLKRFAIGRLQFEALPAEHSFVQGANSLTDVDTVLNVHIPSSGALLYEDCRSSYLRAGVFFRKQFDLFAKRPCAFRCRSWLLLPALQPLLPANSGISRFAGDYTVVTTRSDPDFRDAWRIFNCDYNGKPENLPRETSLQRACADYLAAGNTFGAATGFFFLKDQE